MKVYITGAAGFVGSHLVPILINDGHEITVLYKSYSEKKKIKQKVKIMVGNLASDTSWHKSLKNQEIIIHLAAEIASKSKQDFVKNNTIATRNLIKQANQYKVNKIVLFSSAAVTSIRQDWYSETKNEQEEIVKSSKLQFAILRPSMIYGPGDTKNIGWLIKMVNILPIIPLPGGGKFGRQPVYVEDICRVVSKIIKNKLSNKIYEIHGKEYVTMAQMVKTITKESNSHKPTIPIPEFLLIFSFWLLGKVFRNPKFTTDQIRSLLSGEKFKGDAWWEIFKIKPTSFEVGVSKMLESN